MAVRMSQSPETDALVQWAEAIHKLAVARTSLKRAGDARTRRQARREVERAQRECRKQKDRVWRQSRVR